MDKDSVVILPVGVPIPEGSDNAEIIAQLQLDGTVNVLINRNESNLGVTMPETFNHTNSFMKYIAEIRGVRATKWRQATGDWVVTPDPESVGVRSGFKSRGTPAERQERVRKSKENALENRRHPNDNKPVRTAEEQLLENAKKMQAAKERDDAGDHPNQKKED